MPGSEGDNIKTRFASLGLPDSYMVGERLRASTVNGLLKVARDSARTGIGKSLGEFPERPQLVQAKNVSGGEILWRQAVEIIGGSLFEPSVVEFDVPSADGVELIAITAEPIADDAIGWVYTQGECLVQYSGAAPATGDRLGSENGLTTVQALASGNLLTIDTTTIGGVNYAVVRMLAPTVAGTHVIPAFVGAIDETEAARIDTWDRTAQGANDGVVITILSRMAYSDVGDEKLYGYYRQYTFDSVGQLVLVSVETRVTIDTPTLCA